MPSRPSRLFPLSATADHLLYVAENQRDAEFLASQFDCQVVVRPRPEQNLSRVPETFKRLERSNVWPIPDVYDAQTFGTQKRLDV